MAELLENPYARAGAIVLGSLVVAFIIEFAFRHVLLAFTRKTATELDDQVVLALERPVYLTIVFVAFAWATREANLHSTLVRISDGLLKTTAIVVWSFAGARILALVFRSLASRSRDNGFIQPRTQPLFDIFSQIAIFAAASYAILLSWNVNIGGWMASAGIAGIALGFAAKDSLSNLFAGIFIIADAPYSLGDFIVLDGEMRGSVTAIGFRSTRLLTLDDIEVVVPNSLIGNARIVNESGGPYKKARVSVKVECAYGSDVDKVKKVLLECAEGARHVESEPSAMVRFADFGASGLVHQLLVWIEHPRYRELVTDDLNRRIYQAFNKNGIEIPYSKHDLFIKQLPPGLPLLSKSA